MSNYIVELEDVKLENQYKEPIFKDGWTETTQNLFERYVLDCKVKIRKHTRSAQYFDQRNRQLSIPTIVLSGLVAGSSAINLSDDSPKILGYTVTLLAIASTVMDMLFANLALGKRSEKHRQAINSYADLARKIEQQLFLPFEERDSVQVNFDAFHKEFKLINGTEPLIPRHIDKLVNIEVESLRSHK